MEEYLIYLRKSRRDQEQERQSGVSDTLLRHRQTLLALAKRREYHIARVFEEVASGDTIAERPEMQKLLRAVETGRYAGVLVMEVPRLARGSTRDQGTVLETFQCAGTKIITPDRVYDPRDESDEEYFEFGLFMSRREYKAINRRMQRGRLASLAEGNYIASTPPYGYRRVRKQRGYTLEPVPGAAETVREIFRLYTAGAPRPDGGASPIGSQGIAGLLNARGVPAPGGGRWTASSVRDILKNPTYAGWLRWSHRPTRRQMKDSGRSVSHPVNHDAVLYRGAHPPLVSEETWEAARRLLERRAHAPVPGRKRIANPLAGLLRCAVCGRSMVQLPQGDRGAPLLRCPTAGCATVGSRRDAVERAVLEAMRQWLRDYVLRWEEGASDAPEDEEAEAAARSLRQLERELDALRGQRERLHELLERGVYSEALFLERSRLLDERERNAGEQRRVLSAHLAALRAAGAGPGNPLAGVRHVLDVYDRLETPEERNALLKAVLDHAVYEKTAGGRWKKSDLKLYLYPGLPRRAAGEQRAF